MSIPVQRLKEKKVVQWVLAYLAGAFVALQLMDALESALGLTARTQQSVVILLATGLVLTVILAWSHGEKGRQRPSAGEMIALLITLAVGVSAAAVHRAGGDAVEASGDAVAVSGDSLGPGGAGAAGTEGGDPASGAPGVARAEEAAVDASQADAERPGEIVPGEDEPALATPASGRQQADFAVIPTLSPSSPSLFVGDSLRLRLDPDGPARWDSSDPSVVMVASDGLALAVGAGSAEIVVSVDGAEASTTITVTEPVATRVEVAPVGSLQVGESARPEVVVQLSNGRIRDRGPLIWSSSDSTVVRVGRDGSVTALAAGVARISAEVEGVVGSVPVTVEGTAAPAESVSLPSDEVLFALLERYRVALEARRVEDVEAVHPTLSSEARARWEQLFRLGELRVEFTGMTTRRAETGAAQVEFQQTLTGDRIEANSTRFVAYLAPRGEGWVIAELRSLGPSG